MRKTRKKAMVMTMATALVAGTIGTHPVFADTATKAYTVNMNVSYADFYKMFGVNTMENITSDTYTDAVSSATKTKPYNTGLNPAAYVTGNAQTDDAVYIQGVKLPVQVTEADKEALVKAGAYTSEDFTEVSESNSSFFKATIVDPSKVVSSGAITSEAVNLSTTYEEPKVLTGVNAGYTTLSRYGDYEFQLSGDDITNVISKTVPYGVIVNTLEGDKYALYSQENIWRVSDLAWSAGIVTTAHGCQLRGEPYKKSIGQTVTSFSYITNAGLYTVDIEDTKLADIIATKDTTFTSVAGELADSTEVTAKFEKLPADYQPGFIYKKNGKGAVETPVEEIVKNADGTYTVKIKDLLPGKYSLVAEDKNKKYPQKSTDFTVTGSNVSVAGTSLVLSPAKGKDTIENYVSNISKVSVATQGAVVVDYVTKKSGTGIIRVANIVNNDGTINTDATYIMYQTEGTGRNVEYKEIGTGRVFIEGNNTITVTADNYAPVTAVIDLKKQNQEPQATPAPTTTAPVETLQPTVSPIPEQLKTQKVVIKTLSKKISFKTLKKKAQKFKIQATANTKVTFTKVSGTKKISVTKNGTVTVAKKLKKGTYKITVQATAVENDTYKKVTVKKIIKIVVK